MSEHQVTSFNLHSDANANAHGACPKHQYDGITTTAAIAGCTLSRCSAATPVCRMDSIGYKATPHIFGYTRSTAATRATKNTPVRFWMPGWRSYAKHLSPPSNCQASVSGCGTMRTAEAAVAAAAAAAAVFALLRARLSAALLCCDRPGAIVSSSRCTMMAAESCPNAEELSARILSCDQKLRT